MSNLKRSVDTKNAPPPLKRQRMAPGFRISRGQDTPQPSSSRFVTLSQDDVNQGTLRARNRILPGPSEISSSQAASELPSETSTIVEDVPVAAHETPAEDHSNVEETRPKEKRKRQTKNTVSILPRWKLQS